jgi:hypothetical protein
MANEKLTLVIESADDSEHVSLDDFVAQLDALRTALERTDASLNGGQQTIEWEVVGLSHSSPATIELRARPTRRPRITKVPPSDVIRAFNSNVELLNGRLPPAANLDYSAVNSYRALGASVGAGRIRATVTTPFGMLHLKPEIETTAAMVLEEDVVTQSSYKGVLEFINIHGRKNEFRIYPSAGPSFVACAFDVSKLEEAKGAVGNNIRVYGKLIYKARSPFPYRIEVERIQVLQADSDLPGLLSLRGIAPLATGDVSSEEFVRRLRDAS